MNDLEHENTRLRKENEELRKKENEKAIAIKLVIFVGFVGLSGYIQCFSTIAALVVGCAGFYICFMR